MALSDILAMFGGGNSPAEPSYGAGAAAAATNPLAAVAAPTASANQDDIRQAHAQTLMQLAPLLIGAGMRQMPSQRAATVAASAAVLGQTPHNILNAAQTRLLNQREAQAQTAYAQQQRAVQSALADPNVHPAIKQLIQADPDNGLKVLAQQSLPTDIERNAAAVGMTPRDMFEREHPTKEYSVVSDGMGGFIKYNKNTGESEPIGTPNSTPLPGQPGAAPSAQQPSAAPLANPSKAFGPSLDPLRAGAASFSGTDISPSTAEGLRTRENVQMLRNRIIGTLASDLPGVKSKFQYQNLDAMLPSVGSWFTGPQVAMEKFRGIMPVLEQQKQEAAASYSNARTKKDRDEAFQSYNKIDAISKELGGLVNGLDANIHGKAYTPAEDAARTQVGGSVGGNAGSSDILDIARRHIQ